MSEQGPPKRRNLQGWGLVLLFFGPLLVALFLYFNTGWRPGGTNNHGELVIPPLAIPELSLPTPDGGSTGADLFRQHWSLVYVARTPCEQACLDALYNGRQMRLALGHLMERVQRVYLYTGTAPDAEFLAVEHPDLRVASAAAPDAAVVLAAFTGQEEGYWVVDPLGNVMMRYPPDQAPRGMLDDLKRLLRLSRIG